MITLKKAYAEYIETQVNDSVFEKDLSTNQYLCWSIPHERIETNYTWLGEKIDTIVVRSKRYVWLGNKGSVYVTATPKFEKKSADDNGFQHEMKKWVWKKYYNIDL